ncbi:MAG: menaquinone biosynthetic enzyme MqnA/MqnD family protein [Planctomycetota bacterium]
MQDSVQHNSAMPDGAEEHWRLGVVSYLNSRPLIAGLDQLANFELAFDVPARLPALLDHGQVDAALVPVVDLVRPGRDWQIVSDACIGCDGETLTVRVFSRVPAEQVRRLHVDGDSHTSVMLARILWREQYGVELEILPYCGKDSHAECEAILLIGDKVVNHGLIDFEIETDLGSAWKSLTSLPFVFAVWAMPNGTNSETLAAHLSRARDAGVATAGLIAQDYGPGLGFPVRVAVRYLTARLKFYLGAQQREGMERFLALAKQYDMVPENQELVFA